ncbi:MAG: hypothetical protein WCI03_03230 [bacterium]|jgi:hypothetical protein
MIDFIKNRHRIARRGWGGQLTTFSPHLDLLPLQTVILVQRETGGDPVFWRPSESKDVQNWASVSDAC